MLEPSEAIKLIIQSIYIPGICGLVLFIFTIIDKTFPEKTIRKFYAAITCAILLLITDSLYTYFLEVRGNAFLRELSNTGSYVFKICTIGYVVAITQRNNEKMVRFIYSLMIVNFVLVILNQLPIEHLRGMVVEIKPDHSYHAGPLYQIPFFICYIYMTIMIFSGIKQLHTNLGEAILCILICIICAIANFLGYQPKFKLILPCTIIMCICFYFLSMNVQMYRRDTLTNLLNRRSFFMDAKRHYHQNMSIISMDLNDLKKYNDTEGHNAGDQAIVTCVKYMQDAFKKLGKVYRIGGDEFMALFIEKDAAKVLQAQEQFKQELSMTKYKVACGFAEYKPGDDFEHTVSLSDEAMYKNKAKIKELTGGTIR